jgi:hypothetical protein
MAYHFTSRFTVASLDARGALARLGRSTDGAPSAAGRVGARPVPDEWLT